MSTHRKLQTHSEIHLHTQCALHSLQSSKTSQFNQGNFLHRRQRRGTDTKVKSAEG